MALDESLAARIRDALARTKGVEERKMFGSICFLQGGVSFSTFKRRLGGRNYCISHR